MAQHDRNLLKRADIERFKVWLDANEQAWRPGKGDYQLLQVKIGKGWPAICVDAKNVVTTPTDLAPLINLFKQGKQLAKPATDQDRALLVQAGHKQFLDDLRDDFAMAALPNFLELDRTEIWNQGNGFMAPNAPDKAAMAAKAAYCVADAMMAERAKRIKA